jgi:hypothetical protein
MLKRSLILGTTLFPMLAIADDGPKAPKIEKVEGTFMCEMKPKSVCVNPCKTWAEAQPNFKYSFDTCFADCRKRVRCLTDD